MKNKKGFTLIELLAIIVILAIIAVITVPIILNIIDDAQSGAAVDSAYGFKDAIEKYYVEEMAHNSSFDLADGSYTINSDGTLLQNGEVYNINMSGTKPTSGTITYQDGKMKDACLVINNYKIEYKNGKFVSDGAGECNQELTCYGKMRKDNYEYIATPQQCRSFLYDVMIANNELDDGFESTYGVMCDGEEVEGMTAETLFIRFTYGDLDPQYLIDNEILKITGSENRCIEESDFYFNSETGVLNGIDIDYELYGNLNIPSSIDGVPVTSIGEFAFQGESLTSVEIPNSVTNIEMYAFSMNQLTSATIPNSVTSIGESAFGYNQLTSVVIPNSVTTIDNAAFEYNNLTSVTIPNSVTFIGERAFENNELTSVVIPSSVTEIGGYAFDSNQLTSVTIPNSVTSIGVGAFANNPNLIINVEGYTEKPAGWDEMWNVTSDFGMGAYEVNWNYGG